MAEILLQNFFRLLLISTQLFFSASNVSLNQQHPLGTPTSGNSVPQSNMTSQHSTNAHGRLGMNNIPMNSSVSVPTSHGGMWDMGGNSNVSVAASSVSTKTTTALPSFIDAMPRNPIGDVSSSYSEGGLPSITTAANFLSAQNNADDFLPESILNDIMEVSFKLYNFIHCLIYSVNSECEK